ncbi:hypothetical protein Y032_0063g3415 [Ancylostoma ceylanicum]|nr:hypothetical protein Y032_0063g3415 [Ancylostoma ceylanicum]
MTSTFEGDILEHLQRHDDSSLSYGLVKPLSSAYIVKYDGGLLTRSSDKLDLSILAFTSDRSILSARRLTSELLEQETITATPLDHPFFSIMCHSSWMDCPHSYVNQMSQFYSRRSFQEMKPLQKRLQPTGFAEVDE